MINTSTSKAVSRFRGRFALMHNLVITFLVLTSPASAFGDYFTDKVVGVIDGDSIRVMHNGRAEEIRLHGIDCPE